MKSPVRLHSFVFAMIALLAWSCCAIAQPKSTTSVVIGKVDFRALVLLHPYMVNYDPQKSAFKIEGGKSGSQAKIQERSKERQDRVQQLEHEVKALRTKLGGLHESQGKDLAALNDKYVSSIANLATGPAGMKQQQFEIDRVRLESLYQAKLKSISGQIRLATEELGRLDKVAFHPGFTTPEETVSRMNAMVEEIRQVVQKIATQRGIQVVLNSSFHRSLRAAVEAEVSMPADLSYSQIFSLPFTPELKGNHDLTAGYYENLAGLTQNWLKNGNAILGPLKSGLMDSDIIIGGADLTGEVLSVLFNAYKVNPTIAAAILKAATGQQ